MKMTFYRAVERIHRCGWFYPKKQVGIWVWMLRIVFFGAIIAILMGGCKGLDKPSDFLFNAEHFLLLNEATFMQYLQEDFVVKGTGLKPECFLSYDSQTFLLKGQNIFIGYQLTSEANLPHHWSPPRQTGRDKLNEILEGNEKKALKDGEKPPDKSIEDILEKHIIDTVYAIELFLPYKASKPLVISMLGYPLEKFRREYSDEGLWRHPELGRTIMVSHTKQNNTHVLVSVSSKAKTIRKSRASVEARMEAEYWWDRTFGEKKLIDNEN